MQLKLKKLPEFLPIFVLNIVIILFVILAQNNLPPVLPLFYGMPYGKEQLADKILLILPPLIAMGVAIVSSLLVKVLKDDFLQKVLLVAMYTATLLSIITIIKIISLVSSII